MYIYIYIHTHTQKYTFYVSTNIHPLTRFNPLNADLNPICHLLVLLGAHHILHISRIRVNIVVAAYPAFVYVVSRAGRQVPLPPCTRKNAHKYRVSTLHNLISTFHIFTTFLL